MSATPHPWSGRTLGNYVLRSLLGQGGMGMVFTATHRFLGHPVAVKVLHGHFARDPSLARRFFQEARITRTLDHPNVVKIFDFGQSDAGELYLVMELLEGQSLSRVIAAAPQGLDEATTATIAGAIADGLTAVHETEVIHRDLKPDNIFIGRDGLVKILDFGIAKVASGSEHTATGMVLGTPQYMAPEQGRKGKPVGPHTDIYALGVVLFKMLTGRLPFVGDDIAAIVMGHLLDPPPRPRSLAPMSSEMERLVLDCLEKDPQDRPRASEVRERLAALRMARIDLTPLAASPSAVTLVPEALPSLSDSAFQIDQIDGIDETGQRRAAKAAHATELLSEPTTATASAGEVVASPVATAKGHWIAGAAALLVLVVGTATVVTLSRRPSAAPAATATLPSVPPPAPAPPQDKLVIASEPAQARVLLGGAIVGVTPTVVTVRLPEEVTLTLEGYQPARLILRKAEDVLVKLQPLPAPVKAAPTSRPVRKRALEPLD